MAIKAQEVIDKKIPISPREKVNVLKEMEKQTGAKTKIDAIATNTTVLKKKVKAQQSWQKKKIAPDIKNNEESPKFAP